MTKVGLKACTSADISRTICELLQWKRTAAPARRSVAVLGCGARPLDHLHARLCENDGAPLRLEFSDQAHARAANGRAAVERLKP
jgi:hypothetical protein